MNRIIHVFHAFAVNKARTDGVTEIDEEISFIDDFCKDMERAGWETYVTEFDWEPAPED